MKEFDCDPELPCLFLNALCTALTDLIKARKVVVQSALTKRSRPSTPPDESAILRSSDGEEESEVPRHGHTAEEPLGRKMIVDTCAENGDDERSSKRTCEGASATSSYRKTGLDPSECSNKSPTDEDDQDVVCGRNSKPRLGYEVLTREAFDTIMKDAICVFLISVQLNPMASAIAAKLKTLCELV